MNFSDFYSGSALSGAMAGALPGLLTGHPYLAVAGGAAGMYTGASANSERRGAANSQISNIDQILRNIQATNKGRYDSYINGVNQAIQYFQPATQAWTRAYGTGQQIQPNAYGAWTGANMR